MKTIIREVFLYTIALFLLDQLFTFITIGSYGVLLTTAVALFLLNTVGKPFLKILWLPINIITLGLFSWVIHIAVIVLVVLFVPGFTLTPFDMPAIQIGKILIPAIHMKMFWTYFVFSFLLSQTTAIFRWLLVDE